MTMFKCPYCQTEYELIWARLSHQQRSYANCQVCQKTMYSWSSRTVPCFTLAKATESKASESKPVGDKPAEGKLVTGKTPG